MSDEREDPTGIKAPSVVSQNYCSSMSYKEILGSIEQDFSPKKSSLGAVGVSRPKIVHRVQFIDFPADEDPEPLSMLSASGLQADPSELEIRIEDEPAYQHPRDHTDNAREEEKIAETVSANEQQADFPTEQGEEPSGIKAPTVVSQNITTSSFRELLGSIERDFSPKKTEYYDATDDSLRRAPTFQFINIPIDQEPEPLSQISVSGAPFSQLVTASDEEERSQLSQPWDQDEESHQTNRNVQTVDILVDREPDPISQISITGALPENRSVLSRQSESEAAPVLYFRHNGQVEEAQKKQANKRERRVLWWILATILLLSSLLVGVFFAGYCAHGDCIKKISSSQSPLSDTPAPSPFFSLKPFPPSFYFNEPTSSNVPSVSKNPGEVSPVGTTTIHNESPAYQTSKTAPPTTMAYRAIEIVEYVNRMRLFPYPIEYPPQSNTPEENALKWLIEIDPLQLDLNDRFRLIQRYALQTFMFSSPFSEPSKSTTFVDECDWFGVFCTNGVVTKIDFQDNSQLQFSIPYDLGLLISLQSINLQRTGLQGSIPDSIGNLKDLLYFNVAENNLSGTIPRNLAGCLNLWKAAFYSNALTGSVPSAICELDSIYEIVVDCTLECECCRCL